jgi:hypothetical protein
LDQAIRSSFSFRTREVRAELGTRVRQYYNVAVRYSLERTTLFDERFTEDQKPLIDRIFPGQAVEGRHLGDPRQARRHRRPRPGRLVILTQRWPPDDRFGGGLRQSVRPAVQLLPASAARRIVLATGVRIGASHGPRTVRVVGDDGVVGSEVVRTCPRASAFSPAETRRFVDLPSTGWGRRDDQPRRDSRRGQREVVLNAELRVAVFKGISGVMFVDAGNVFPRRATSR